MPAAASPMAWRRLGFARAALTPQWRSFAARKGSILVRCLPLSAVHRPVYLYHLLIDMQGTCLGSSPGLSPQMKTFSCVSCIVSSPFLFARH